jgi:hypothetical protein
MSIDTQRPADGIVSMQERLRIRPCSVVGPRTMRRENSQILNIRGGQRKLHSSLCEARMSEFIRFVGHCKVKEGHGGKIYLEFWQPSRPVCLPLETGFCDAVCRRMTFSGIISAKATHRFSHVAALHRLTSGLSQPFCFTTAFHSSDQPTTIVCPPLFFLR